jgi:methyl-accepting chemotaxis protein
MSRWLRMGLTDKLFLPFFGILLISVMLTTFFALVVQERADHQRTEAFLGRIKEQWHATTRTLWARGEIEQLHQIFRDAVESDTLLNTIALYSSSGEIVTSNGLNGHTGIGTGVVIPVIGPNGDAGRLVLGFAERFKTGRSYGIITAILVTGLSTIVVGAFIYMKVLDRVLLKRIRAASAAASAIASRDLTQRIEVKGEDELTLLAEAFNTMAENLSTLTRAIHTVVGEIDDEAVGIMNSVESQSSLSSTQTEQVSQITQTMGSMAELSRQIANSSMEVVKIAGETLQSSDRGVMVTDDTRGLMDQIASGNSERVQHISELKRRANQIGDVMQFIEHIADQTKLIAFNASIEAAGAGEMGRRFEVVAREIRRLAENVSESTVQIRTRITDIQQSIETLAAKSVEESQKVQQGSQAALHTVTVLHSIREGANRTTGEIQEISEAIRRQNSAADDLLASLTVIDKQSAQLSEGLTNLRFIASALKGLSTNLHEMSSSFILDETGSG